MAISHTKAEDWYRCHYQKGTVMDQSIRTVSKREPWNKGKLVGQKAPLRLKEIWAIRIRLQIGNRARELALFNLAVDSKLRSCDLVKLRVRDVVQGERVAARAVVMQQKTQRPVQFEITEQTRDALVTWIRDQGLRGDQFLFPSCVFRPNALFRIMPSGNASSGRIRKNLRPTSHDPVA